MYYVSCWIGGFRHANKIKDEKQLRTFVAGLKELHAFDIRIVKGKEIKLEDLRNETNK